MKEYEEAIKLLEKVDPIKKREKIPPEKYNLPATVAQDYGWYSKPLVKRIYFHVISNQMKWSASMHLYPPPEYYVVFLSLWVFWIECILPDINLLLDIHVVQT